MTGSLFFALVVVSGWSRVSRPYVVGKLGFDHHEFRVLIYSFFCYQQNRNGVPRRTRYKSGGSDGI